jgi:curved DNA-binding protein CbpA
MNKNDCTAYAGPNFAIEWFYSETGKSNSYEHYEKLSNPQKRKLFLLFKRMGDFGRVNDITKFRNEGDEIYVFKPQPGRFLSFFVKGKKIIITNAFRKKSQKLPEAEKQRA